MDGIHCLRQKSDAVKFTDDRRYCIEVQMPVYQWDHSADSHRTVFPNDSHDLLLPV